MVGTLVNAGAILLGGAAGLAMRRDLSPRHQLFLKTLLGVLAIYTGFRMVWNSVGGRWSQVLLELGVTLLALMIGNLVGRTLGLQTQLNKLGQFARQRFNRARQTGRYDPGEGFVTCTILFCVGPLAILGALQDGLQNDPRTLLIKAAMDGLGTLAFIKVFGPGVMLSAGPVLAYQGTITLAARYLRPFLENPALLDGLGAVGGLLVAATALIILDVYKVRLADYLPALILGPVFWLFVR